LPEGAKWHIGNCFTKGVIVEGVSALAVGGIAFGAVSVGVPAFVVSSGLLVAGGTGMIGEAASMYIHVEGGNYGGLAYDVGSALGGLAGGMGLAGHLGPKLSRVWNGPGSCCGLNLG
jgi:hypothetical protein